MLSQGWAQQAAPPSDLYERINDSLFRFNYDSKYYLVQKDCEYKAIERVIGYDTEKKVFNGKFMDFGPQGNILLEGQYINGIKNGEFIAYHPNQEVKWEVVFKDNRPSGEWRYYYPDGNPMLTVAFHDSTFAILSQWDRFGEQTVTGGEGTYTFVNPYPTFHPMGYTFYRFSSELSGGKAGIGERGLQIWFFDGDYPEDGQFNNYDAVTRWSHSTLLLQLDEGNLTASNLSLLPDERFYQAENFFFKNCNFDEHTGFLFYLNAALNEAFQLQKTELPSTDISIRLGVNQYGELRSVRVLTKLPSDTRRTISALFQSIPGYLPSFVNGKYVNDTLTINGRMHVSEDGQIRFTLSDIHRKREHGNVKN